MMGKVWAETALTARGWEHAVAVSVGGDGRIESVTAGAAPTGEIVDVLLPAPVNLHSHAFQRAMAGRSERRGMFGTEDFWSWREELYRLVDILTPEDIESITALAQMEMLEAGFAAVAEFHYLHHARGGTSYGNPAEMSERVVGAAEQTGIGLTLLPVLYERGGCDGRSPVQGQERFACGLKRFEGIVERASRSLASLSADAKLGVAPHSLRAVGADGIREAAAMDPDGPVHIHIAEQQAEVSEVAKFFKATPVTWLLGSFPVDQRWCLVHCTQTTPDEVRSLAQSGAVVGLCPVTEANLGDGIFACDALASAGGAFGVGTDSNVCISLAEELRMLEYGQRLRDCARARVASPGASVGRTLFDRACAGGAQAAARDSGVIESGLWADLVSLDARTGLLAGAEEDGILDAFVFAGGDRAVADVWAAGRHVVREGRHVRRDRIVAAYRSTMSSLWSQS